MCCCQLGVNKSTLLKNTSKLLGTLKEDLNERLISNVKERQLQCRGGGGALPSPSANEGGFCPTL